MGCRRKNYHLLNLCWLHTFFWPLSLFLSLSFTHTHTHTHSLSQIFPFCSRYPFCVSHKNFYTRICFASLTHTHALTHTHSHALTRSLSELFPHSRERIVLLSSSKLFICFVPKNNALLIILMFRNALSLLWLTHKHIIVYR